MDSERACSPLLLTGNRSLSSVSLSFGKGELDRRGSVAWPGNNVSEVYTSSCKLGADAGAAGGGCCGVGGGLLRRGTCRPGADAARVAVRKPGALYRADLTGPTGVAVVPVTDGNRGNDPERCSSSDSASGADALLRPRHSLSSLPLIAPQLRECDFCAARSKAAGDLRASHPAPPRVPRESAARSADSKLPRHENRSQSLATLPRLAVASNIS